MPVRLLKPIGGRPVGTVLDVPGGVGETWILQRKAEAVLTPDPAREQHMVPQNRRGKRMTA